jgi:hypothetical protein
MRLKTYLGEAQKLCASRVWWHIRPAGTGCQYADLSLFAGMKKLPLPPGSGSSTMNKSRRCAAADGGA